METNDLTCQELVELVTAYLENTLSEVDRARFEVHLTVCNGCTHYVEQMRVTIQLVGRLSETMIAPEPKRVLLDAFREWHHQNSTPKS